MNIGLPFLQMRAMAILYIGPHRNPDFQSDYQLSPILAPDRLLAQFPPLLMSCGEKDPFVDDTLIFAGRVREAKRARRVELERIIAGKSSQFGESLRMSNHDLGHDQYMRALEREHERLAAETEEDWVRMHIFSEWSHGYLQMPSLMREVRGVIDDLADWMVEVFTANEVLSGDSIPARVSSKHRGASSSPKGKGGRLSTARRTINKETDSATSTTNSETEFDTDEVLTFAPKRQAPSSYSNARRGSSGSSNGTARHGPSMSHDGSMSQGSKAPSPPPNGTNGDLRRTAMIHETPTAGSRDADMPPGNLPATPKRPGSMTPGSAPTPTKGGQTISESELMRRRRLLDSHLISQSSQDSVK